MSAEDQMANGAGRLRDHADDCPECQAAPLPLATLHRVLSTGPVPRDVTNLSADAMAFVRPALERNARRAMWRHTMTAVSVALLPLPMVAAYAALVLRGLYSLACTVLPAAVAGYLVGSYAAALALMVAVTYAAIPVWLATRSRDLAPAGR